ncbi:unnamed protein product [Effrenium voratum]|nr:unnamed protein product [Effrenium voratum]
MDFEEVLKRVSHAVNHLICDGHYNHCPPLDMDYDVNAECLAIKPTDEIVRMVDSLTTVAIASELQKEFPMIKGHSSFFFEFPSIQQISEALHRGDRNLELESLKPEHVKIYPLPPGKKDIPAGACTPELVFFTQLLDTHSQACLHPLHCPKGDFHFSTKDGRFQRRSDGMECLLIPGAEVRIGGGTLEKAERGEQPTHLVKLTSFLMDVEPVSVGAYVRFLNLLIPPPTQAELLDWCVLAPGDMRQCHSPIVRRDERWHVKEDVLPNWPMILVSWYGANAYSLWAHGEDWHDYKRARHSFLPSEAQWEYAARGTEPQSYPWGEALHAALLNVCWDQRVLLELADAKLQELPMDPVNLTRGVSSFGLRGMAGNVWQWCRDTYDPTFYSSALSVCDNAWNSQEGRAKSERGGSWAGPPHLARSSCRRGRIPEAKGRCLGFRCCAPATFVAS